jgi:hypothetical protein
MPGQRRGAAPAPKTSTKKKRSRQPAPAAKQTAPTARQAKKDALAAVKRWQRMQAGITKTRNREPEQPRPLRESRLTLTERASRAAAKRWEDPEQRRIASARASIRMAAMWALARLGKRALEPKRKKAA